MKIHFPDGDELWPDIFDVFCIMDIPVVILRFLSASKTNMLLCHVFPSK